VAVYAYSDLNRITTYLADNELIWRGTWAAGTTYSPPDAVYHTDGNMWIALLASTNVSPTAIMRQRMWSQLVYYKERPPLGRWESVYDLAVQGTNAAANALSVAQSGTAGVEQVLQIAVAGTTLAQEAYNIAVAGTNLAQAAYNLAEAGTDAAAAAQATADTAISTANGAMAVATAAINLEQKAYALAAIGTNVGTNALNTANAAMNLLSVGLSGTHAVWVAPSSGSPATLQMFIVNGIVTAIV